MRPNGSPPKEAPAAAGVGRVTSMARWLARRRQATAAAPRLSVVMPVYNAERTLGECLERLFQSSYRDFELILVDDGSTDRTRAIASQFPVRIVATSGRVDLQAVFIPDVMRVDTTTGPVPLIGAGGNRLSGLGGDTTGGKWSGWPNGRRLGDDVVDIALTAVASGPTYSSIFLLGDNINANDYAYNLVFPYAATPHGGTTNRKDPGVAEPAGP